MQINEQLHVMFFFFFLLCPFLNNDFMDAFLSATFSLCFVPVVLPVRSDKSDAVLIFDLRRRRFLCVDLRGELYSSVSV